jgi:protease-4
MRQFLKYTLASLTGSILFFLLMGFLLTLGAVGLAGALVASLARGGDSPTVEKDSVLVYDLSTLVPDSPILQGPGDFVVNGPVPPQVALRQAVLALDAAAEDDQIVALYLKGSSTTVGTGLANQQEIYQALTRFKESGKPILAYDVDWSEREYALVALADTLYLHPFGSLEMNGLYSETLYQADALDKLGIGVQVTRTGAYKSAVEPFTNNAMSPQEREQTQRLLQDLWQGLLTDISTARSLAPQQLQTIANTQGFLFGEAAKTQGLINELAYEDEVVAALRGLTGEESPDADEVDFRQIDLPAYAATVEDALANRTAKSQVAVVYAEGPIVYGEAGDDGLGTGLIAGDTLARQLRQLRQDDQVKAVVLRVNSPGGSALASEVILREIQLIQAEGIPVVVSMGDVAASGGYWIAASADAIVAQPGTITGSIGVFSLFLNLEDLSNTVGLNWEGVKTAELADIFSISRPKTERELAILQSTVDTLYTAFLDRVEAGRELPREQVANLAQGRIWSGQASQGLGLVDELGGLQVAIEKAAELAELGDDWRLESYPQPSDWQQFWASFLSAQAQPSPSPDSLTAQGQRLLSESLTLVQTLNDPRGLYMRVPFTLTID